MHVQSYCLCFLATTIVATSLAGQPREATLVTKEGQTVRGIFKGASQNEIEMEIAGQSIRIALDKVKYVSFVGEVGADTAQLQKAPSNQAFESLKQVQSALKIGLLHRQYADKLQQVLPAVVSYIDAGCDQRKDVELALRFAVQQYQDALHPDNWSSAASRWELAGSATAYAQEIQSQDPAGYHERDNEIDVALGATLSGRLGYGDRLMPESLVKRSAGTFNDVYSLTLQNATEVTISVRSAPFLSPHITLVDPAGRAVMEYQGYYGKAETFQKCNDPGMYKLWIGTERPYEVGVYTLKVGAR